MGETRMKIELPVLQNALRRRAASRRWMAVGQIAGGLGASILIPAVLALLMLLGTRRAIGMSTPLDWTACFLLIFVLFMPVAYFLEWQTQGGFLMRKLLEIERSDGGWYAAITRDRTWRWHAREGAAQWEMLLFAPRMVFGGFAKLRGMRLVADAESDRTAETLGILVGLDHGVEISKLRRAGQTELGLSRVLSYLMFYDWVGVSENGMKVWALTASREELGLA
jgi:hypothetical protein